MYLLCASLDVCVLAYMGGISMPFFSASAMAAGLRLATMAKKFIRSIVVTEEVVWFFTALLAEHTAAGCDKGAGYVKAFGEQAVDTTASLSQRILQISWQEAHESKWQSQVSLGGKCMSTKRFAKVWNAQS